MNRRDRAWIGTFGAAAALILVAMAFAVIPDPDSRQGIIAYLIPVAMANALLVIGVTRIRRAERGPWAWLAASAVIWLVGEFVSARYELAGDDTWPNPSEVFFLIGQVSLVGAVLAINRRRSAVTHRGDVLDSAIVAAGGGVLSVVFFVLPGLVDDSISLLSRLVSSAYPILDILLVYIVARMIITPSGRAPSYWLLLGAQLAMLGADSAWNLIQLVEGSSTFPRWVILLWQAGYLLFALAACATGLTNSRGEKSATDSGGGLSQRRLLILTVASLLPSVVLVVLSSWDRLTDPTWLGAGSIVLGVLVSIRIWDLLQQLRVQTAKVAALAAADPLTQLPNRRSWDQELARACRPGALGPLSRVVALLDLDLFKAYNDRHGHQAGDELLRAAAHAWRRTLDGNGVLARWGGEEFAVLLVDSDAGRAIATLERLRAEVPDGQTCSVGVAVWDGQEAPEATLRRADQALYAAKAAGRDRLVLARDTPDRAVSPPVERVR